MKLSMRKILTTIMAAVCVLVAQAAPRIVWLNPTYNFGAFREEVGPVTCVFEGVNVGDEPVVVIDARANCGCTRPAYDREPIAPGDTLRVSVAYDPAGRPGRFSKQVKVATSNGKTAVLRIRGTVIGSSNTLRSRYPEQSGAIRFSNRISPFGETRKGNVLASAVNIYNPTPDTIYPAVTRKPAYINVLIRPEAVAPGEQGTLSMTAYTDMTDGWGLIEDSLSVVFDRNHPDWTATIQTVMIVNEDFTKLTEQQRADAPTADLSETTLDFGVIDPAAGAVSRRFTVANHGRSALLIRRLYSPDKAVAVKASSMKVKPGKKATVTVTVDPAAIRPSATGDTILNARITLIANAPESPSQIIRVVGTEK